MKKLLLSFLVIIMATFTFAQTQRYVIVEEFTNASCGPCAAQNPAFQALMAANTSNALTLLTIGIIQDPMTRCTWLILQKTKAE
ncbi:MAG: hypothetical protein IPH84_16485 [Bacteroidales bacterium]|nr:hypothetical protein [Bacteroidales bacterium]